MGPRYWSFRISYELRKRSGILKNKYPVEYPSLPFQKSEWVRLDARFFFQSRKNLHFDKTPARELQENAENIFNGKIKFFHGTLLDLGKEYDWLTHPLTGYQFKKNQHWTEIGEFNLQQGDVKYVWEKSRFCYAYDIIRYDYHFNRDSSAFIFSEILSWINNNPVNCGPNYISSQEIALRVLNWTFILFFYRDSPALTEEIYCAIANSIYRQLQHIEQNIQFSRIAVRNNHTLTETLCLYLCGILFPFFKESQEWKTRGKNLFTEEINYQVYDDGSYLQYSMNYHRVVIQLLTWAIQISRVNREQLDESVSGKAYKSLVFLYACANGQSGQLPNYGANDGSLFFPLNSESYRNYLPQLEALAAVLGIEIPGKSYEDRFWITNETRINSWPKINGKSIASFTKGGYYIIRETNEFTFIRCGSHRDRPAQADNLHIDLWFGAENVLRDAGTYLYNSGKEIVDFFSGTRSHNTVMLGNYNQMKKGSRFIWNFRSQAIRAELLEKEDSYVFHGKIKAFRESGRWVFHTRSVKKIKAQQQCEIEDELSEPEGETMHQVWNPSEKGHDLLSISATDEKGNAIQPIYRPGWYSETYGSKEPSRQIWFSTHGRKIKTVIRIKNIA